MARQTNVGIPLHSAFKGGESDTVREIPPEWRAALDILVLEQPVPYDKPIPDLASEILAVKREQKFTSEATIRETTTDTELPAILLETYTDKYKQIGERTRKFHFIDDLPFITVPSATRDVNTKNFGNKHFEETIEDTGTLFVHQSYEEEIPDIIPPKYRVLLPTSTEEHEEIGVAVDPTLGTGDLRKREEQLDVFVKKMLRVHRDPSTLPVSLTDYKLTKDKQIETVIGTLDTGLQTITGVSELTVEASVDNLGNNLSLKEIGTVASLFQAKVSSTEIPDLIPQEFRAVLPTLGEEITVAGTVVDPPVLGLGQFEKRENQLDVFTKRVMTRGRDATALPATLTNFETTEEFGGGVLGVVLTLDDAPMLPVENFLVTDSKMISLGGGLYLRTTKEKDTAWNILTSELWDPDMRQTYEEITQVVAAGTSPDPNPGVFGWTSEIKAIDWVRSKKINISKPMPAYVDSASALISYVSRPYKFPGLMPNYLIANFRQANATLVKHKIRTWWEIGATAPVVAEDEIITDSAIMVDLAGTGYQFVHDVLHDAYLIGTQYFYATTPTYSEYVGYLFPGGVGTGTLAYTSGSAAVVGTGTLFTTELAVGDNFGNPFWSIFSITDNTHLTLTNPFPATISGVPIVAFRPSIAWRGSERIIASSVTPEREKDLWKVVTQSVIMR